MTLAAYILAAWFGVAFTLGPVVGRILAAQSPAPEKSNEPHAFPAEASARLVDRNGV